MINRNKYLERAIRNAKHEGKLRLVNKKIEIDSFDANLLAKELRDTVSADLSKNHYHEAPYFLCLLSNLQDLVLSYNVIRSIHEDFSFLQNLQTLTLNCNSLTELPKCLCQLVYLETLLVRNNRLCSIPPQIESLSCLIELDLSYNLLTSLPPEIGSLKSLRILLLNNNLLLELPVEVTQLQLMILDISSNRLSCLPAALQNMDSLEQLHIYGNPLIYPAIHVQLKGIHHIMKNIRKNEKLEKDCLYEHELRKQITLIDFTNRLGRKYVRLRSNQRTRQKALEVPGSEMTDSGYGSAKNLMGRSTSVELGSKFQLGDSPLPEEDCRLAEAVLNTDMRFQSNQGNSGTGDSSALTSKARRISDSSSEDEVVHMGLMTASELTETNFSDDNSRSSESLSSHHNELLGIQTVLSSEEILVEQADALSNPECFAKLIYQNGHSGSSEIDMEELPVTKPLIFDALEKCSLFSEPAGRPNREFRNILRTLSQEMHFSEDKNLTQSFLECLDIRQDDKSSMLEMQELVPIGASDSEKSASISHVEDVPPSMSETLPSHSTIATSTDTTDDSEHHSEDEEPSPTRQRIIRECLSNQRKRDADAILNIFSTHCSTVRLPSQPDRLVKRLQKGRALQEFLIRLRPGIMGQVFSRVDYEKNAKVFLSACRDIGVPEECICSVQDITGAGSNLSPLRHTMEALVRQARHPPVQQHCIALFCFFIFMSAVIVFGVCNPLQDFVS